MRTQPHSNAKRFIKSCRKRLQHLPRVGAEKDNYQQKGPVKTKKLTVGNFYIFHTLAVIALSFLKLLIKIKWKNIKKNPTVSFKIQVFGTELDSWWRLKSSLLRRALKIVSPCRAFCIVLFSICVINRWGDAVHLLKLVALIWFTPSKTSFCPILYHFNLKPSVFYIKSPRKSQIILTSSFSVV